VHADRERILQVLANLVGNAIKFTPPGGCITLTARPDGDGGMVTLSVRDTGCGIEPDQIERVFDRFWSTREGTVGGAGLGLAIARGIVEAHGGAIGVESEPGGGTTFRFTLPVA
jgi:signal transduction histidine kinase